MFGQLVLLPAIALALAWTFHLPPVFFIGLVLIACCPGGSSSNVFSKLAGGTTLSTLASTTLGWSSDVWDFSGSLPTLVNNPEN